MGLDPAGQWEMGMGQALSPAHPKIPLRLGGALCSWDTSPRSRSLGFLGIVPLSASLVGRWGWIGPSSLLSEGEELMTRFPHYTGLKIHF